MEKTTKVIYVVLFVLLLIHPHFITGHISSIPGAYSQSIVTLIIVVFAYGIYVLHHRDIKRKEQEKNLVEKKLKISSSKLIDAFKYIGFVNRRLPLLKNLTTDMLKRPALNKQDKKNILYDLLAIAAGSIAKADWGMFRFIDVSFGNTRKEYVHTAPQQSLPKTQVSNQELLKAKGGQVQEVGDTRVIPTSDRTSTVQCFMVFSRKSRLLNDELSVLQSVVDQAQLFYNYLYNDC